VKIDSSQPSLRPSSTESKDSSARISSGQSVARSEVPSTVTRLSGMSDGNAASDVNPARVAELRQAIREGRLQINAERIADGLIASVREQLGEE
jgi:negative regulator of flagellin synthesis FlgM